MPQIAYVSGFLPFLDLLHTIKTFSARLPTRFSHKNFPQHFPTRISSKNFLQEFLATFSCNIFLQHFPTRSSCKNFPQHFPARFSCKIFLQDFPTRFSCKIFPQDFHKLDPDWLAPHHPIPNAKFPPMTALLNMPTYHKSAKVSPPPFPKKSHGNPKSMNKLTLNEPAIRYPWIMFTYTKQNIYFVRRGCHNIP